MPQTNATPPPPPAEGRRWTPSSETEVSLEGAGIPGSEDGCENTELPLVLGLLGLQIRANCRDPRDGANLRVDMEPAPPLEVRKGLSPSGATLGLDAPGLLPCGCPCSLTDCHSLF